MAERRVVTAAGSARSIGRPIGAAPTPEPAPEPEAPKRSNRAAVLLGVLLGLVLLGGGGYLAASTWLAPESGESAETLEAAAVAAEPGVLMPVEPVSVNLADGRYLRLGFSVQFADGADSVEPARAQDVAIDLFSGRDLAEIHNADTRNELKDNLTTRLNELTDGEVIEVYLTDYVTQ